MYGPARSVAAAEQYALVITYHQGEQMGATRRAAALLAATALLTVPAAAGTASAASMPPIVGTMQVGATGIPTTVHRGTTINIVIWYRNNSKYDDAVLMDGVSIWHGNTSSWRATKGVSVSLRAPLTGRWAAVPSLRGSNDYDSSNYGVDVNATPGYWEHYDLRLTVGAATPTGDLYVQLEPAQEYQLMNKGKPFEGYLSEYFPIYKIQVK